MARGAKDISNYLILQLLYRLLDVFDGDDFRSFKLICPKCRRVNIFFVCTC